MALTPGPIQAALTLASGDNTVLTSAILQTIDVDLDIVTAATITLSLTPAGGSKIAMFASKTYSAGDHVYYTGIPIGVGDILTINSNQADTTCIVAQSSLQQTHDNRNTTVTGANKTATTGSTVFATYFLPATLAAAVNTFFFIATRSVTIKAISEIHGVAAGGASTMTVEKLTGTTAPGSGTSTQTGSFNLNATANTVQVGVPVTTAVATLAAGDRLGVVWANAIQSTTTLCVTVELSVN